MRGGQALTAIALGGEKTTLTGLILSRRIWVLDLRAIRLHHLASGRRLSWRDGGSRLVVERAGGLPESTLLSVAGWRPFSHRSWPSWILAPSINSISCQPGQQYSSSCPACRQILSSRLGRIEHPYSCIIELATIIGMPLFKILSNEPKSAVTSSDGAPLTRGLQGALRMAIWRLAF